MSEIVRLRQPTKVSQNPDDILAQAQGQDFKDVVVIGLTQDGDPSIRASTSDAERLIYLMEIAKRRFMDLVLATETSNA